MGDGRARAQVNWRAAPAPERCCTVMPCPLRRPPTAPWSIRGSPESSAARRPPTGHRASLGRGSCPSEIAYISLQIVTDCYTCFYPPEIVTIAGTTMVRLNALLGVALLLVALTSTASAGVSRGRPRGGAAARVVASALDSRLPLALLLPNLGQHKLGARGAPRRAERATRFGAGARGLCARHAHAVRNPPSTPRAAPGRRRPASSSPPTRHAPPCCLCLHSGLRCFGAAAASPRRRAPCCSRRRIGQTPL
jgi:hypothetical protein